MTVERTRFDEGDEFGDEQASYHGWYVTYRDAAGEIEGRLYDHEPDVLLFGLDDNGSPYDNPRFARAILQVMEYSGVNRAECLGCGTEVLDGVPLDVGRLQAAARDIHQR